MSEKPSDRNRIAAIGSTRLQRYPPGVRPYRVDISLSIKARIVRADAKLRCVPEVRRRATKPCAFGSITFVARSLYLEVEKTFA